MKIKLNKGLKALLIAGLTVSLAACGGKQQTIEVVQPATPAPTVTPEENVKYIEFDYSKVNEDNEFAAVTYYIYYQVGELEKEITPEDINDMLAKFRQGLIAEGSVDADDLKYITTPGIKQDTAYLSKENLKDFVEYTINPLTVIAIEDAAKPKSKSN